MKTITATEFARNFRAVLDSVVSHKQAVLIRRNNQAVACISPTPGEMDALEALGDLYQTLPPEAAEGWLENRSTDTIDEVRNPWDLS